MSIMSSVKSAVYQSQTSSIVRPYSGGKESVAIKAGDFLLNGKKIAITKGDSLKSIAEKINKLAPQTGVRARIVKKDDGYGLHLVSKNKPVGIQDPNGVLANLYSKGHIGKSSKHLIQVTGGEIFYNRPLPRSQQHSQALMDMFKVVKPHNTEPNPNRLVVLNEVHGAIEENLNPQEVVLNDLSEILENNLFQLQNSPEADDAAGDISEIGNFDFDFSGEVSEDDGDQTVFTLSDDELALEEELQPQELALDDSAVGPEAISEPVLEDADDDISETPMPTEDLVQMSPPPVLSAPSVLPAPSAPSVLPAPPVLSAPSAPSSLFSSSQPSTPSLPPVISDRPTLKPGSGEKIHNLRMMKNYILRYVDYKKSNHLERDALCKRLGVKGLNFDYLVGEDFAKYEKIYNSDAFEAIVRRVKLAKQLPQSSISKGKKGSSVTPKLTPSSAAKPKAPLSIKPKMLKPIKLFP